MFPYVRVRGSYSAFCCGLVCSLISLLGVSDGAFASDYVQLEPFGVPGIGVYYDEMFRGKVNPAAVGSRQESLAFDVINEITQADVFSLRAEYNTNRLSISDTRSDLARVRFHFEDDTLTKQYPAFQGADELFLVTTSFNIDLSRSVRLGVGQRVSHFTGLNFVPDEEFGPGFAAFDTDLTAFAVDLGIAVKMSRNIYLSLYGQNVASFIFGELLLNPIVYDENDFLDMDLTSPELDLAIPIVLGGGPSIALAQLVASLDAYYLPQVGDSLGLRGTAFYTLFLGGDRFRLKLGVGLQTVASADWLDDFKTEAVGSFWASERLSLKYAIGVAQTPLEGTNHSYQRIGLSWLWE